MLGVDRAIFVAGILLLVGLLSSKISARFGLPVLVLFVGVGMMAGSEGVGGIAFENYSLAYAVGTLALATILFDGGLRTRLDAVRRTLAPSLTLATVGVLVTAAITGAAAHWLVGLPWMEALLLGSIVASTDAAAVFTVLRSHGVRVAERVGATLEIESGSNDPMAILLTIGVVEILRGQMTLGPDLLWFFVRQMGLGLVAGVLAGEAAAWLVRRINLESAGLYPVLTATAGLLAFGVPAVLGGSGFLAVYVAGVVLGNRRIVFQRGILLFHDGAAWLAQIAMFVLLGLLSSPSRVVAVAGPAIALGAVLMLVARPVAVAICLLPLRFSVREMVFVTWGGLKGAVPIILAIIPLLYGIPDGAVIFDIVFFVVLTSAIAQGWTLPPLARRLGLEEPARPEAPVSLEITSLRDVDSDIVEYTVEPGARAANRRVRELALPDGVVIAMIAREGQVIPPRGSTLVLPGDHVFLVLRPGARPLVDHVFSAAAAEAPLPAAVEFPLVGQTTAAELEEFYGIVLDARPGTTLDALLRGRLGARLAVGERLAVDGVTLVVREIGDDGTVERVGLAIESGEH